MRGAAHAQRQLRRVWPATPARSRPPWAWPASSCPPRLLVAGRPRALEDGPRRSAGLFALAMTGPHRLVRAAAPCSPWCSAWSWCTALLLSRCGAARRRGALVAVAAAAVVPGRRVRRDPSPAARPTRRRSGAPRASPTRSPTTRSRTRFDHWGNTLEKVADEPLGTGLGTVGRATAEGRRAVFTDNSYLKVLREQGIPGGVAVRHSASGDPRSAVAVRLVRLDPLRRPARARPASPRRSRGSSC